MTEDENEKGHEIAHLRKQRGMTQEALGKLAGTIGKYISDLKQGVPLESIYFKKDK